MGSGDPVQARHGCVLSGSLREQGADEFAADAADHQSLLAVGEEALRPVGRAAVDERGRAIASVEVDGEAEPVVVGAAVDAG